MMILGDLIENNFGKEAAKCDPKLEPDEVQIMLPPVVQSGGNFDLKWCIASIWICTFFFSVYIDTWMRVHATDKCAGIYRYVCR